MFNKKFRAILCKQSSFASRSNHFAAKYLNKCEANYAPLSPLSPFLRTVRLYPKKTAYVYGEISRTWEEVGQRAARFASALQKTGIARGDVVSIISPNIPALYESHFAVPGVGAVLHTINTRLDATTIAFQLGHCGAKIVFVDTEFNHLMLDVKRILKERDVPLPSFINIRDTVETAKHHKHDKSHYSHKDHQHAHLEPIGNIEYEDFLTTGDPAFTLLRPQDELDPITLNYTSGTTGSPKGVVTHHRGAYLNAMGNQVEWNMEKFARFLWVVPMFHCNGWCFPWTISNSAGTSYFLRQVRAEPMYDIIEKHKIQYMAAAPVVLNMLLTYPQRRRIHHTVKWWIAGSPPAPSVMKAFTEEIGIHVQTAYGLTESYGPVSTYVEDEAWATLSPEEFASRAIVQCGDVTVEDIRVLDPETMKPVPDDSKTIGEIMMRGNILMKGYLGNEEATTEAFKDGWFHTGDLGVSHGNGRFELKDRSKDIIISGGENISSVEVETIMMRHPAVLEVAVVAMPDAKWQEVPCAFVTLKPDHMMDKEVTPTEGDLLQWCRQKMPHYQTPKKIVFAELPKTTTGKVQKVQLRELAKSWGTHHK